ncbi:PD-(D/E)XK nuclease family protein [Tessaracoccus sp. Y36]
MWSYSSLRDVEGCPRRYALSRANYPDLWEQNGYPRMPIPPAIRGNVVHGALEIILKALVKAGYTSTRSAEAVAVLRELGGYTKVAEEVLADQLAQFDGNPRLSSDRREKLTRGLTDWMPQAREQIQTYLNRMELRPSAASRAGTPQSDPAVRYPAQPGDHLEKELVAGSLRLQGRIDLLSVDADGAQITDFKTGVVDPVHHDQLQLYALLWSEDDMVNPDGLPVTRLVVAYPSHDVAAAVPTAEDLTKLRSQVSARIDAADAAAIGEPPAAIVADHCGLCSVRGLCDTYWASRTVPTVEVAEGAWYDLTGTVVREHGVKSFVLREAGTNSEVLVRTPTPSYAVTMDREIRIIGARRVVDADEEDALIAAVASVSEVLEMTE